MTNQSNHEELYQAILKLSSIEDCNLFFNDLCTYKELDSMSQRIKSAKMLFEGKTYDAIIKETDISSATLSRVSKCVKYGEGYKKILK